MMTVDIKKYILRETGRSFPSGHILIPTSPSCFHENHKIKYFVGMQATKAAIHYYESLLKKELDDLLDLKRSEMSNDKSILRFIIPSYKTKNQIRSELSDEDLFDHLLASRGGNYFRHVALYCLLDT